MVAILFHERIKKMSKASLQSPSEQGGTQSKPAGAPAEEAKDGPQEARHETKAAPDDDEVWQERALLNAGVRSDSPVNTSELGK